jgi:hypothetical protein
MMLKYYPYGDFRESYKGVITTDVDSVEVGCEEYEGDWE